MKNISRWGLLLFVAALIAPQSSYAYYTTHQEATKITDQSAFYTLTYSFGLPDADVYLPITTQRTDINDMGNAAVGYTFNASVDGDSNAGTSAGLVLSNAIIVDNMYKVPAGTRATFTLFTILTLDQSDAKAKYALQATNLPYKKVTLDGEEKQLGLNIHELTHYVTPKVGLNK